jgi:hypothetical protein
MLNALKLEETLEKDPGAQGRFMRHPVVLPLTAARNEVRIHFAILGGEFHGLVRRNPVAGPRLNRFAPTM